MNEDQMRHENLEKILHSPSYRVAYKDVDFLMRPKMRATRMELELLKPECIFERDNIGSTIVVFGSTRIVEPAAAQRRLEEARARLAETPDDPRRQRAVARAERSRPRATTTTSAREFARLVSSECQKSSRAIT